MAGISGVGNVGGGVTSSRSTGSNVKEQPTVKNTPSSSPAAVKAASPTTSVRSAGSNTRDTSASTTTRSNGSEMSGNGGGGGSNGIAAAANVGGGVTPSASTGNSGSGGLADAIGSSTPWQQFDDWTSDTSIPVRSAAQIRQDANQAALAASDSPGSSLSVNDFLYNVRNGSLGMPGAAGYGKTYDPNSRIGFDPMKQDTAAMDASLAAPTGPSIADLAHALNGPYLARQAANGGVPPFEGVIDSNYMLHELNAPYLRRMAASAAPAVGGTPGGPTTREVQTIPIHAAEAAPVNDWPAAWSALLNGSDRLPSDTGLIPGTAPAYADGNPRHVARTLNPDGSYSEPLQAIETLTASNDTTMPVDSSVPLNSRAPVSVTVHGGSDTSTAPAGDKPSTWDKVVDNTGKLLSHTGLGSLVSGMFPDLWNGMGDTFKGLDNGGSGKVSAIVPYDPLSDNEIANRARDRPNDGYDFIDLNHNGIDDRLEGVPATGIAAAATTPSTDATGFSGNQFRSNRYATFPDMPPYRPGVDDEWNYFHDHLARGGVVGYAERDPRVSMIADAEDALHRGDHQHESITKFVDTFGPKALENLNNNVLAGHRMRAGMPGRTVVGPGGPTDDAVPAVIDGQHPAKLSSGEFVVPVAAVEGIGGGDPKVGADRLHDLVSRFAAK